MTMMTTEEIIEIAEAFGFTIDFDQREKKGWIRFQLSAELDEPDLRLIWYVDKPLIINLKRAAYILFEAGRKSMKVEFKRLLS